MVFVASKAYAKEYYKRNKEVIKKRTAEWQKTNKHRRPRWHLKHKYNLSIEQFEQMKKKQDYKCAICKQEVALVVDHDHKTNNIRGLLCKKCNLGLGHFNDEISRLKNAVNYMEEFVIFNG